MSRCRTTITPYRTTQDCEAAEAVASDGGWYGDLDWATLGSGPTEPAAVSPWGNAAVRERLAAAVSRRPDGNFAGPESAITAPDRGGFGGRVALTFDDGPDLATTPRVLDILDAHGIRATFFVHGERVESDEARALLARMTASGHTVGNHGERHENLGRDPARARESVAATHARIAEHQAGHARWFRFPGGNASAASIVQVESQGYAVAGWHVDSADWCYADPRGGVGVCDPATFRWVPDRHRRDMIGNILEQTRKFDGGVVLLHDDRAYTADKLDEILRSLRDAGFTFTDLHDGDAFPVLAGWAASVNP